MSKCSTAEQLVQVLRQAGVERVYGVVGESLNPFVDAIRRTDGIAWMQRLLRAGQPAVAVRGEPCVLKCGNSDQSEIRLGGCCRQGRGSQS